MQFARIVGAVIILGFLIGMTPIAASAVTVSTKPSIAKPVPHNIVSVKKTPHKKVPVKKVIVKKKPAPKHKVIVRKHKPFLIINAPLLDPNNPPSSPNPAGR